jgi:hypothetical protein
MVLLKDVCECEMGTILCGVDLSRRGCLGCSRKAGWSTAENLLRRWSFGGNLFGDDPVSTEIPQCHRDDEERPLQFGRTRQRDINPSACRADDEGQCTTNCKFYHPETPKLVLGVL